MSAATDYRQQLEENFHTWAELTSLVLELRKACLRRDEPDLNDDELEIRVWAELRLIKEQKWTEETK